MMAVTPNPRNIVVATAILTAEAWAHGHHHEGPADNSMPIDAVLKMHMIFQAAVWTILFPATMVLGLIRHRLHVPLAALSLALTVLGYFLGHGHKGRSFPHTAHSTLGFIIVFYLIAQTVLGSYLKLHLKWKTEAWVRPPVLFVHGLLGKTFPVLGWSQMVLGIVTLQSWCFGGNLGQCLAHYIMGSSFVAYSAILLIMLKAGFGWLARRGKSQEWFDSWVICLWGFVNTFTEHHGGSWTHKDLQHTTMGVVWFFGGAVGIWTARNGKRNVFPGIVIVITGWAMSGHTQELMLSTTVHALFGYALMAAGVARIIEVCFVPNDRPTGDSDTSPDPMSTDRHEMLTAFLPPPQFEELRGPSDWSRVRAFQFLPPWLLTAAGVLFMSATDEELRWGDSIGVDHITWGLVDFSIAFFFFLWFNVLLDFYTTSGGRYGAKASADAQSSAAEQGRTGGRAWYSRLSVGQRPSTTATAASGDQQPLHFLEGQDRVPLRSMGLTGAANGRHNSSGGGRARRGKEEYESDDGQTHVLFEDDLDAGELDPFDDEPIHHRPYQ